MTALAEEQASLSMMRHSSGFTLAKQQAFEEEMARREADAKAMEEARRRRRRRSQGDYWYFFQASNCHNDFEEPVDDEEDDCFQMIDCRAGISRCTTAPRGGEGAAVHVVHLVDLEEGDDLESSNCSTIVEGAVPVEPSCSVVGLPSSEDELEYLRQMLANLKEERDVHVAIVQEELMEKQLVIDDLVKKREEAEASLRQLTTSHGDNLDKQRVGEGNKTIDDACPGNQPRPSAAQLLPASGKKSQSRKYGALMEGWVWKRSRYLKVWRRRWLVLTRYHLASYKHADAAVPTEAITKGFVTYIGKADSETQQDFCIVAANREFLFFCDSKEQRDEWLRVAENTLAA
eukprot:gnl/TRDRNA2_/TRDRNA2_54530_c0_seq1.p1 gnl/TRDRNA2_/TRDRNA2_54530_c0~~gnl/TRDRNA2_/TRDRNA2_54530_c0_seq1.p1  ORF type:complete len:346 (+),score=76.92 gnl/TRDRNA2_/TRDRNA2_54530_c0_seq1:75-1112(+)